MKLKLLVFSAIFLFALFFIPSSAIGATPLLYEPFESDAGIAANGGTLTGTHSYGAGHDAGSGNALYLPSASALYYSSSAFDKNYAKIDFWFRPESLAGSGLFSIGDLSTTNSLGAFVAVHPTYKTRHVVLEVRNASMSYWQAWSNAIPWETGRWYHVVAEFACGQGMKVTVDGSTGYFVNLNICGSYSPRSAMHIGHSGWYGDADAHYDEFKLWNERNVYAPEIKDSSPTEANTVIAEGYSRLFSVNALDADGDTLSYDWKLDGSSVSNSNRYSYSAKPGDAGTHSVSVSVSDGLHSESKPWSVQVIGAPPLQPFHETFESDDEIASNGGTLVGTHSYGTGHDASSGNALYLPPTSSLSYSSAGKFDKNFTKIDFWFNASATSGKYGLLSLGELESKNSLGMFVTAGSGGARFIVLEVRDNNGYYQQAWSNAIPWIAGRWYHIEAEFACNSQMKVSVDGSTGYAVPLNLCGKFSPNMVMQVGHTGFYEDADGYFDEWKLLKQNHAPTIDSFSPTNLNPAISEGESIAFSITASDSDGDALGYEWKRDNAVVSNTPHYTYQTRAGDAGNHAIQATVSDGQLAATKQWNVQVGAVQPPKTSIEWMLSQQAKFSTGLIQSQPSVGDSRAFLYDQALAVIALTQSGKHAESRKILDKLKLLQQPTGYWYSAYKATDASPWEWKHDTGAISWAVMAIHYYERVTGDYQYDSTALKAIDWLKTRRDSNATSPTYGAFNLGANWWDVPNSENVYGTEHQLDAYTVFRIRALMDSNPTRKAEWNEIASGVSNYLAREAWHPPVFWRGYNDPEIWSDAQSWSVLAFNNSFQGNDLTQSIDYMENNMRQTIDWNSSIPQVQGFSYTNYMRSVWVEGTLQTVSAMQLVGRNSSATQYLNQMNRLRSADGGLPYSFSDSTPTWIRYPENFRHNALSSIAWQHFATKSFNPFSESCGSAACHELPTTNQAPTIDAFQPTNLNPSISEGDSIQFSVTASDADGDALSYAWTLDGTAASSTASYAYQSATGDAGIHVVKVVVSDGSASVSKQWNVHVGVVGLTEIALSADGEKTMTVPSGGKVRIYTKNSQRDWARKTTFNVASGTVVKITRETTTNALGVPKVRVKAFKNGVKKYSAKTGNTSIEIKAVFSPN